jgi:hypothetical protein
MPGLAKWVNSNFLKGFTIQQVAKKHDWPESLLRSQALVKADDFNRFKALQWGIRTRDMWNFTKCAPGLAKTAWPDSGQAGGVYNVFFSESNDLVLVLKDWLDRGENPRVFEGDDFNTI